MSERIDRDFKGHLIVSESCEWFRTTDVAGHRISSIGEYRQPGTPGFTEIGWGRKYETMVFPLGERVCGCGCAAPEVSSWSEVDSDGYNSRKAAEAGHERMVAKYLAAEVTK